MPASPALKTMFKVTNRTHLNRLPDHVYIGRGSYWGNPFPMKSKSLAERKRVLDQFRDHLWEKIIAKDLDLEKKTKDLLDMEKQYGTVYLSCFCNPLDCHGDVIVSYLCWYKTIFMEESKSV
jgi:hypothetical protein